MASELKLRILGNMQTRRAVLAINGGKPVFNGKLPEIHNHDRKEVAAATRVIMHGPLSGFVGVAGKRFLGGREVRALEASFAKKFKVKHAVSFNSATTALHAAIVALEIGPGDEVIVPPYSMSASATAILANGAVPIFADIDERTFCIDPKSVRRRITKNTKAIMVVNLYGQAADFTELLQIAKQRKLKLIEDNAQSPGAKWKGKFAGTIGDVGVFSFNVHKTMQTGEGGMLVTNSARAAQRAQLCRNHGEAVVDQMPQYDAGPIFGSHYRMPELIAAIARIQITRLDHLTRKRQALAAHLTKRLAKIPGITPPFVHPGNTHVYYRYTIKVNPKILGISRDTLAEAMAAEGFPISKGYVRPIHLLPVFQSRRAFNNTEFPFKNSYYDGNPDYSKGTCPVVERLEEQEITLTDICQHPNTKKHTDLFVQALLKVLAHKDELR